MDSAGRLRQAAERMAFVAGVSARVAAAPTADVERVISESADDLLLHIGADRWTFVLDGGRRCIGHPLTPPVLETVEETLRSRLPIVTSVPDPAAVDSAPAPPRSIAAAAVSTAGVPIGVITFEQPGPEPWPADALGLVRATADIFGGGLARRQAEDAARRAGDMYRRLLETSAEGVCLLAADGTIKFANKAFATMVREATGSLAGAPILRFLPRADAHDVAPRLLHETGRFEVELLRRDGSRVWTSCSTSALGEDAVDGSLALVMMTDISMRRAAEAALRSSEARFRALVRSSSDVIVVTDTSGLVSYASPSVRDVLGHDPADLQGTSPLLLVHEADLPAVEARVIALWEARQGSLVVRCRVAASDGTFRHMEIALTNLIDDSAVAGMTLTARDISAELELQASLTHEATHDAVTGLYNRRIFNARLDDVLRSPATPCAVMFADLDGFKAVNDRLGHDVGDELLRVVGARISEAVRDGDLAVRYGGDEFAILCPGVSSTAECELVARRVVSLVTADFSVRGGNVAVGVSLGIALSTDALGASAATLIAAADAAMYEAKSSGSGWRFAGENGPTVAGGPEPA